MARNFTLTLVSTQMLNKSHRLKFFIFLFIVGVLVFMGQFFFGPGLTEGGTYLGNNVYLYDPGEDGKELFYLKDSTSVTLVGESVQNIKWDDKKLNVVQRKTKIYVDEQGVGRRDLLNQCKYWLIDTEFMEVTEVDGKEFSSDFKGVCSSFKN